MLGEVIYGQFSWPTASLGFLPMPANEPKVGRQQPPIKSVGDEEYRFP